MTPKYLAVTAYGAEIPKAFGRRSEAIRWAEQNASVFPGCMIVMRANGKQRVVWKHVERVAA